MNKVALIIIYNHQYDTNIPVLEGLYQNRFSNIYHLVPFYSGDKTNVIPVYENSRFFQGYVAQGLKSFYKAEYDHYFFMADDLYLNPVINETNYAQHLKLGPGSSFLPGIINLHECNTLWPRVADAFYFNLNTEGVEAQGQLPDYDTALKAFNKFNLVIKPLKFNQIWRTPSGFTDLPKFGPKELLRYLKSRIKKTTYKMSYPMVGGYADIFAISAETIKQFCHYCGVMAATNLFVEVAIPTAVVLTAKEIVTENDLDLQGKALWTKEDFAILDKYEFKIEKLQKEFPPGCLYIHPIKLSKWAMV